MNKKHCIVFQLEIYSCSTRYQLSMLNRISQSWWNFFSSHDVGAVREQLCTNMFFR